MRWSLVFIAGCNPVFGLHDVDPAPPEYFDAPIDAPFTCPPIGTAPAFRHTLHTLPITDCLAYTFAHGPDRAIASCVDIASNRLLVHEGPIDGTLNEVASQTVEDHATYDYFEPRLSADGDDFVRLRHALSPIYHWQVEVSHRDALGSWTPSPVLIYDQAQTAVSSAPYVSSISAAPDRRVIVIDQPSGMQPTLHEYADRAGWTEIATYPSASISALIFNPSISADGRRMVFIGPDGVRYADRASKDDPFGASQLLMGVPGAFAGHAVILDWPVLDDDCGKVYVSALNGEFFLEQD